MVWDDDDWVKIPQRYSAALQRVYAYISPPICSDGTGSGRNDVFAETGRGAVTRGACGPRGSGGVNFDERWNSMLRGFYSIAKRVVPLAGQNETTTALRAAFLDLTNMIFPPNDNGSNNVGTTTVAAMAGARVTIAGLAETGQKKSANVEASNAEREEVVEEAKEDGRVPLDEETKHSAARGIQKSIKGVGRKLSSSRARSSN